MRTVSSVLAFVKMVLSRQECLVGVKVHGDTTETTGKNIMILVKLVKGSGTDLHTGLETQLAVESTSFQDPLSLLRTVRSWVSDKEATAEVLIR